MEGKKPAKAEHIPLSPQLPAKQNLHSASVMQTSTSRAAPNEQNKTNNLKKSLMAAPRALLNKEGILKAEDCITTESLYTAFKVLHKKFRSQVPPEVQKVMIAFLASLGVLMAEKNMELDPGVMVTGTICLT